MNELHIGRGTSRDRMTVFPIWSAQAGTSRHTLDADRLDVRELEHGPSVDTLDVGNTGDKAVLVLEGQLFEGGWQHRMAKQSVVVGARQRIPVAVACVEQGRWGGSGRQHSRGRRVTPYIADAVRGGHDVQGEVWRRVAEHTAHTDNATGSFVRHLDEAGGLPRGVFRTLTGQVGVLIGIGGQPYVAEVFDSPRALRGQFDAILEAAWLDARHAPAEATPGRRARRFIERSERVHVGSASPAGAGEGFAGRSQHVDLSLVRWQGRVVHQRMSYLAHPMLVGA